MHFLFHGEVTHSAHHRGQVFPAQVEEGKGVVAGHIPDVGAEALGSCGQNKNTVRFGGRGQLCLENMFFPPPVHHKQKTRDKTKNS